MRVKLRVDDEGGMEQAEELAGRGEGGVGAGGGIADHRRVAGEFEFWRGGGVGGDRVGK